MSDNFKKDADVVWPLVECGYEKPAPLPASPVAPAPTYLDGIREAVRETENFLNNLLMSDIASFAGTKGPSSFKAQDMQNESSRQFKEGWNTAVKAALGPNCTWRMKDALNTEEEQLNVAAVIGPDTLVDWLIQHHGLKESSRAIVRNNIRRALAPVATEETQREQFERIWHRVKGHEDEQPKVPNDWAWEKRCAYWVWLKMQSQLIAETVPEAIDDRAKVKRALDALDYLCDIWAEEVDLERIVKYVSGQPDKVRAMLRQCWIEGAYRGRTSHTEFPAQPVGTLERVRERMQAVTGDLIAHHEKEAKSHVSSQWIYSNHMMAVKAYKKSLEILDGILAATPQSQQTGEGNDGR